MVMKTIFIDLDDTLADFSKDPVFNNEPVNEYSVHKMYEPGFFLNLKPVEGALHSVRALIRLGHDVHILTQPLAESAHSYSEKVQWVGKWFPELINKLHMSQNKGFFKGDYLIDDNEEKWKIPFEKNGGKFIHFDHENPGKSWKTIVEYFEGDKDVSKG